MKQPIEIEDFELVSDEQLLGGLSTPSYRHLPTSMFLRLIPGGTVRIGFSADEEEALRNALSDNGDEDSEAGIAFLESVGEMRPVCEVSIKPFLLAPHPLTQSDLMVLLGLKNIKELGNMEDCVSLEVAEQIVSILDGHGLRLPTESEWEYAYRAETDEPFPWGIELPDSPWAPENRFGLEGMGEFAEMCADGWQIDHEGAYDDGSACNLGQKPRVARGGAAEVWPWQNVAEWVTMLSAFRSSSSEHDGFLRIRPAFSLP